MKLRSGKNYSRLQTPANWTTNELLQHFKPCVPITPQYTKHTKENMSKGGKEEEKRVSLK